MSNDKQANKHKRRYNNNNKSNAGVLVILQFIIYALHEN